MILKAANRAFSSVKYALSTIYRMDCIGRSTALKFPIGDTMPMGGAIYFSILGNFVLYFLKYLLAQQ